MRELVQPLKAGVAEPLVKDNRAGDRTAPQLSVIAMSVRSQRTTPTRLTTCSTANKPPHDRVR